MNFYEVLCVSKRATDQELRRAFKTLSRNWDPAKFPSPNSKIEAVRMLEQINQAFDVLIDAPSRQIYDLEKGFSISGAGSRSASSESDAASAMPQKCLDKACVVSCTLEEIFNGTTKMEKITRTVKDINGETTLEEETFAVCIRPGLTKGTEVRFTNKGDIEHNKIAGDVVFIIEEEPHEHFKREGDDLVFTKRIPLVDSLTGFNLDIPTIDGRKMTHEVRNLAKAGNYMRVYDRGMRCSNKPANRGHLEIKFDIEYPSSDLTAEQKSVIRKVFADLH